MALYLIGDVQGCDAALARLLGQVDFSPSRDTIYLLGDLVNRGPQSLQALRRVAGYGASARCVLGNHDLHLLGVAAGVRSMKRGDTLQPVLDAPDRAALLDWLRQQPLAMFEHGWLMVHAGVVPQWSVQQTLAAAAEVEAALRDDPAQGFLRQMYGNEPARWSDELEGFDRLRASVNALTRLRFCTPDGLMDFDSKDDPTTAPPGFLPWFDAPGRRTAGTPIAFGHWSRLGHFERPDLASLDTGCVWGGCLSALRFERAAGARELFQTGCATPGDSGGR